MSVALRVYEQLTEAGEDKVRARVIADGFEQLEERTAPAERSGPISTRVMAALI